MRGISLNTKILALTLGPFLLFNAIMLAASYKTTKEALMQEKRFVLQDVISTAEDVLQYYADQVQEGKITEAEAKEHAKNYIVRLRYGREHDDYVWAQDFEPNMIIHPTSSKLNGTSLKEFKDKAGKKFFVDMATVAKKDGEGYVDYIWSDKKDPTKSAPKLSYVKSFKPWGWVLGTGIYINDVNDYISSLMMKYIAFSALGIIAISFLISFVIKKGVSKPLLEIADNLRMSAQNVTKGSDTTFDTSKVLSEATSHQASSLQETVASIDEISAMINRNSDSAQNSRETSVRSQSAAEDGKRTVDEMLDAIHDISNSNSKVMDRMTHSNTQIGEILDVIKEINTKTSVINDIVFQTKLLSFNASVEAARAGESGKGFAVVAEEVGNLATMSGKASEEIRSLIETSIKKVEGIVSETTSMVDVLIKEGKEKVEGGTNKARECKDALDAILGNVVEVNSKVTEIAEACREQSQGVDEITRAMRLLDSVTHQNNQAASSASASAESLKKEAEKLDQVVFEVIGLVNGQKEKVAI